MTNRLVHRGPDGSRVHIEHPIGLGATRLAIVDLDDRSAQPLHADGCTICFNGEIYNHRALRRELEERGHVFRTSSDTEVVLRLYIAEGMECLQKLRGMFAFAIWDDHRQQLALARDRLGEKPLLYYQREDLFAFASEVNALLAVPGIRRTVNPGAMLQSLVYVTSPAPESCFADIKKLPAAHYMLVHRGGIRLARYWQCRFSAEAMIRDFRQSAFELNRQLEETVPMVCRSDVPVGVSLSGGMDSSTVATLAATDRLVTHSFTVGGQEDPDGRASAVVARALGLEHHEIQLPPITYDLVSKIISHFGEPVMSYGILHTAMLARGIQGRVKVVLTGCGSDEIFGGYREHWMLRKTEQYQKVWRAATRLGLRPSLFSSIPSKRLAGWMKRHEAVASMQARDVAGDLCYGRLLPRLVDFCGPAIPLEEFPSPLESMGRLFDEAGTNSIFDGFMLQQLSRVSTHSLVDIPDCTGMIYSIESRSPFLDHKVVELAARIPAQHKVTFPRQMKAVLRRVLERRLRGFPEARAAVFERPKTGFGEPIEYFARPDVRAFLGVALKSRRLAESGLVRPAFVTRMENSLEHRLPMTPEDKHLLWAAAMTSVWLERFF